MMSRRVSSGRNNNKIIKNPARLIPRDETRRDETSSSPSYLRLEIRWFEVFSGFLRDRAPRFP